MILDRIIMVKILVKYTCFRYTISEKISIWSISKVEFKLDEIVLAGVCGYASVSTNRLVSISSDGQRMLDLG